MDFAEYTKEFRQRVELFFTEKKPEITTHRCCLSLSSKHISFIHINKTVDAIELLHLETFPYEEIEHLRLVLTEIVKRDVLQFTPTYLLLSPHDYQLFLIESLPVKPEELNDALQWRIKSLIHYPLEEAVMNYFKLPPKKAMTSTPTIAAVVARIHTLQPLIEAIQQSNLLLTTIDIPELAMRNLSAYHENDEKSTAFIYFYEDIALLNITRQKTLYFTRQIPLLTEEGKNARPDEEIALDILRYFDYFQSQWRYPTPSRIFIASEGKSIETLEKSFSEHLLLPVKPFSLSPILDTLSETKINKNNVNYLLPLGGALRKEEPHV